MGSSHEEKLSSGTEKSEEAVGEAGRRLLAHHFDAQPRQFVSGEAGTVGGAEEGLNTRPKRRYIRLAAEHLGDRARRLAASQPARGPRSGFDVSILALAHPYAVTSISVIMSRQPDAYAHAYPPYYIPPSSPAQISLLGYSTLVVATNSSFIVLMFTNLPMIAELPALSLVPEALAPPNGCCPTTAPVLLQLM